MNKNKIRQPKIRFKEFSGENADSWEQRKLSEVAEFNPKSELPEEFEYVDLESVVETEMIAHRTELKTAAPSRAQRLAKTGDVFYQTVRPYQRNNYLFEMADNNYVFSTGYAQMRPYIDSNYLMSFIQTDKFVKVVLDNCTGTSYPAINSNDLSNLEINIPKESIEQKKIGMYFKNLDSLITLHQRKLDGLKKLKKTMLSKMFPKHGQNIPELRFQGFTDSWEQRKFTDITFLSGEKNKDNLPYESYSVTNENGFVPQNEQFENGGTMATADKRMYYIVSKNSFAYNPARINVGSIGYYDGPENVIVSSLYEVFKTSEDVDDRYLWHWFKSNNFKKLIEQYQEGGVRLYFYYDKLCMCSLPTPSIQEQIKIGRYFDNLDNLITLHQRKIDDYKKLKKTMLSKMFI